MNMKTEQEITQMAIDAVNNLKACRRDNKGAYGDGFIAGYTACQDEDRWVPVSEKQPNDDESTAYLCYDWYHNQRRVLIFNPHHQSWDDEDGDDYYTDLVGGKVSHYQLLPNPPKK